MTNATQQRYIVRLKLNDREIAQWILDQQPLRIGRTPDNDIVIDFWITMHGGNGGTIILEDAFLNSVVVDESSFTF